jgi:hypothetical protein
MTAPECLRVAPSRSSVGSASASRRAARRARPALELGGELGVRLAVGVEALLPAARAAAPRLADVEVVADLVGHVNGSSCGQPSASLVARPRRRRAASRAREVPALFGEP